MTWILTTFVKEVKIDESLWNYNCFNIIAPNLSSVKWNTSNGKRIKIFWNQEMTSTAKSTLHHRSAPLDYNVIHFHFTCWSFYFAVTFFRYAARIFWIYVADIFVFSSDPVCGGKLIVAPLVALAAHWPVSKRQASLITVKVKVAAVKMHAI